MSAGVGKWRMELGKLERVDSVYPLRIACRSQTVNGEEDGPPNVEYDVEKQFGSGERGRRGTQVPHGTSQ